MDVREGYGEWVRTYEQTVQDEMDLRLLERLQTVDWSAPQAVLDLACGTGRIGVWLRQRGAATIDGVDVTPETWTSEHVVIDAMQEDATASTIATFAVENGKAGAVRVGV